MEPEINPYASPAHATDPVSVPQAGRGTSAKGFRPATRLTQTVVALLGLHIAAALLVTAAMGVWYWDLSQATLTGLDAQRVSQHSAVQAPLVMAEYGLHIAAAILFLFWVYGVHSNLPSLRNRHLEFTPGWAVGWFFVPFANLVKPFHVLREIWRGSDPRAVDPQLPGERESSLALVGWWWGLHLASGLGSLFINALIGQPQTVPEYQTAALILIGGYLALDIPHSALKLLLVRRIYQMQLTRFALLTAPSQDTPVDTISFP